MKRTLGLTAFRTSSRIRAGRAPFGALMYLASALVILGGLSACGDAGTGGEDPMEPDPVDDPAPVVDPEGNNTSTPDNGSPVIPSFDPGVAGTGLTQVTGRAVLEDGTPVELGSFVQVCGSTCFPGEIGADGMFEVSLSVDVSTEPFAVSVKGGSNYAKFYFALPEGSTTGSIDMGELPIFPLPSSGEEIPRDVAAESTFSSGGVTLGLAAGTEVNFDFDALAGGDLGVSFRAQSHSGPDVSDALGFSADHFFALAPFETTFSDAAGEDIDPQLTFELEGAAEGAEFEAYALGSYLFPDFLPAAQFGKIGDVVADASGRVVLDEGVSLLTWVAFVAK